MIQPKHLQELNPEQLQAALHVEGPIVVLAGAGSGKTRVLINRISNLIIAENVRPDQILAVTFTNKAASEMRERLSTVMGERSQAVWISTFHSAALRILRRHAELLNYSADFAVYDADDSKKALKQTITRLNLDIEDYPVRMLSSIIDKAKNSYISVEEFYERQGLDSRAQSFAEIYDNYQRDLLQANAMDFGDLLFNVVSLFEQHPDILSLYQRHIQYVLIDEYQDTNEVQYLFIRMLTALHSNLFVVGDDDQSIYAFRGATIRNILEFEKDFKEAKTVKLEQNYRSTSTILGAANAVIVKNRKRKSKKLWTAGDTGESISCYLAFDEELEASFVVQEIQLLVDSGHNYEDIAIFYRTNAQSRALEEACTLAGIPFRIFGSLKFFERKEIKDILSYLQLILNPRDNQSFLRVVNNPSRGVGAQTVAKLQGAAESLGAPLFTTLLSLESQDKVKHKGLRQFLGLMHSLEKQMESKTLHEVAQAAIEESGYGPRLKARGDDESEGRLENLGELLNVISRIDVSTTSDYDPRAVLRDLLDRAALTAGDEKPELEGEDDAKGFVSLMTLHLAKGLEFPVVFFSGFEEGLVPHARSMQLPEDIEEERRLCYVGITRAMTKLYLTRSATRGMYSAGSGFGAGGAYRVSSRFGADIPHELVDDPGQDFFCSAPVQDDSLELEQEYLAEISGGVSAKNSRFNYTTAPLSTLQAEGSLGGEGIELDVGAIANQELALSDDCLDHEGELQQAIQRQKEMLKRARAKKKHKAPTDINKLLRSGDDLDS